MAGRSPFIWLVGSDESSSLATIGALLDWSSLLQEWDIDEVFSLGGKHDAQAISFHLYHKYRDAKLLVAGELAPVDSH
ncbi:unnamed protein product [Ilex paraguariensis]|uniref:Uncharacterized protein n=1 Tax=Ilex paraguariensis TaxID=185542 RepID=A0ABC8RBV0_9AQUA